MISCLSRAFVQKQLISVLKSWAGRLFWRRRNIVQPVSSVTAATDSCAASDADGRRKNVVLPTTNNVSTLTAVTDSTAANSAKASTAVAKNSSHPLQLGNAQISSASTIAHVNTGGTFCAELSGRFSACASDNAHNSQSHSHFIELDDCMSESKNSNQMTIHMKTLTKVAE